MTESDKSFREARGTFFSFQKAAEGSEMLFGKTTSADLVRAGPQPAAYSVLWHLGAFSAGGPSCSGIETPVLIRTCLAAG